jgi:hypothetical protein
VQCRGLCVTHSSRRTCLIQDRELGG